MIDPITETMIVGQALDAMANVVDPELGIDVVALGLIYDIDVVDDQVVVSMTLTTPGCPVSEQLPAEVDSAVTAALPNSKIEVLVVWDPPWTPDRMATDAFARPHANPKGQALTTVGVRRHSVP